ncbi:MAG: hypothetical protein KF743_14190 [Fimbriimonadaceae bacterium]|nr:hypothetical protein [Fimbriimonadaceae bacterium]
MYHFCYDDKWRIVGTWRGTDTDPKELFIYHAAGVAGYGGSSYIDSVVLRDRDNSAKWSQAADGTLETRHYYAQNWRADVSAIFDNSGAVIEWQKYSAYGVPFLLTPGDHNKNGGISAADQSAFNADFTANSPRADLNRDGVVNSADQALFTASYNAAAVGGRWKLSSVGVANRKGYAGYEHEGFGNDLAVPELAHVRHRVLHFGLGRWTRREPVDARSGTLYLNGRDQPVRAGGSAGAVRLMLGVTHSPPDDELQVICYPLPGAAWLGVEHCYVRCCSGVSDVCHTYSLWPERPDFPDVIFNPGIACRRRDNPMEEPPDRPGSSGGTVRRTETGRGLCECADSHVGRGDTCLNDPPSWRYHLLTCNSNWFAGSIMQCCTGDRGGNPGNAPGWGAGRCCNTMGDFNCQVGSPGAGQKYNRDCTHIAYQ